MVAGNMIGAGVLALPAVARAPGFWMSSGAMVGVWAYCLATGLLIAEVCSGDSRTSIQKMAEATMGPVWGNLMCTGFLVSNYLLMVAYICQGSTMLVGMPLPSSDLTGALFEPHLATVLFTVLVGGSSLWGPAKLVEGANNALVAVIVTSFIGLMAIGLPNVDVSSLSSTWDITTLPSMLPVAVCALVFQNVVPVVSNQLQGDMTKIRAAITMGSGLPLILYILWNAVILGHVAAEVPPDPSLVSSTMDAVASAPLSPIESLGADVSELGVLLGTFSFAALVTSFWGAAISLMTECTQLIESFALGPPHMPSDVQLTSPSKVVENQALIKAGSALLVLVPPALVSIMCPDSFLSALQYSGIYADPLLYGLAPAVMAWKVRSSDPLHNAQIPGGKAGLCGIIGLTVGFMAWQTVLRTL
ncbi:unnamed protein product [Choristocarpus tenellus]